MTASAIAALVSALGGLGMAAVAVALALRSGRLAEDVAMLQTERDHARHDAESALDELNAARIAAAKIEARYLREIERLHADLMACGDDRAVGSMARRGLERLLSQFGAPH